MNYRDMDLPSLLKQMAVGDEMASEELLRRFNGLIVSESKMNGIPLEDVSQDIKAELIQAIQRKFHPEVKR